MKVNVIYSGDLQSELVDIPLSHKFQDLRSYFKDDHGKPAEAVEILSRFDANVGIPVGTG